MPDTYNLYTYLIQEVYDQISTAYPSRDKTYKLIKDQYY